MPIGQVLTAIFATAGCIAAWRLRRGWFWLLLALVAMSSTAIGLIQNGLRWVAIAGPISGSEALAGLLLGTLVWGYAVGFPRRVALILGIGLTSPAIGFSDSMIALSNGAYRSMHTAMVDPGRRSDALHEAEVLVRRMRRIQAPDRDRGRLRDDLADAYQTWIGLIQRGAPQDEVTDHLSAMERSLSRWKDMDEAAGSEQRNLATPAQRRRGSVIWPAAIGFALLLMGIARAQGYGTLHLDATDPRLWTMVGLLVVGGVFVGYSAWVAVRR